MRAELGVATDVRVSFGCFKCLDLFYWALLVFRAVTTNNVVDSEAKQIRRRWYDLESSGAFKQVEFQPAATERTKFLTEQLCLRYQVGMLWAK